MIAVAVNCFVTDASLKTVSGVFGASNSTLASPYPLLTIGLPSRAIRIDPLNRSNSTADFMYSSTLFRISFSVGRFDWADPDWKAKTDNNARRIKDLIFIRDLIRSQSGTKFVQARVQFFDLR